MQVFTKESLTKFQNNLSELQALLKDDISKNNCNLHKLCLPARFQIPQFRDLYYSITGEAFQLLDQHIPQHSQLGGRDLVGMVINNNDFARDFSKFFPNFEGMLQVYSITRRFERDLGKIFTLTPQLIERLLDCAPPSDKITASMFQLPFENIFLEFGNNEQRQECEIKGNYQTFTNVIVEGVYLSEHQGTSSANSKEMKDHFGLTDTDKYRVIEIGVSHSPYSLIGATEAKAGAEQLVNYVHLCIPDEDMPLNEALELNRSWLKGSLPDELFKLAYNTILYLNLDSRLQKAFSMPKETKLRLASTSNPNKRKKAALAASKDYSHIQIGSTTQYRVLSDVNNLLQHKREKGTKSPHARRGYFGTRYITGEDGEKTPKVTWIRNTIIHKELLTSDEIEFLNRQYDVM